MQRYKFRDRHNRDIIRDDQNGAKLTGAAVRTRAEQPPNLTRIPCKLPALYAQLISCTSMIINVVPFARLSRGWYGRCVRSVSGSYGRHATVTDGQRTTSASSAVQRTGEQTGSCIACAIRPVPL